jgi:hypothetical protein
MSAIGGAQQSVKTHSQITAGAPGGGPPPLTGALSTQFNAQFGGPPTPGLGMLNLIMFG